MNTQTELPQFQRLILDAVAAAGRNAYGVRIHQSVEALAGRFVCSAAVYTTLSRMENKGILVSWQTEPIAEPGGRRRRCYRLNDGKPLEPAAPYPGTLVGQSMGMQKLRRLVRKVGQGQSTVLIRGESGTGKELVARQIHVHSPRCDKPFIAVNCAALQESLLESLLFGHERGAFTGATCRHQGQFEIASGGTLLLDEIGDMSLPVQAKVLRVIQERQLCRLGGHVDIPLDVRLIAATHVDLEAAIAQGKFREDLYYRLNVIPIETCPLRERLEDIPALVQAFIRKHASKADREVTGISGSALAILRHHTWPGNVRELENAIERAIAVGTTQNILPRDLRL